MPGKHVVLILTLNPQNDAATYRRQGEVLIYVLPGMFVPGQAQSLRTVGGKKPIKCAATRFLLV